MAYRLRHHSIDSGAHPSVLSTLLVGGGGRKAHTDWGSIRPGKAQKRNPQSSERWTGSRRVHKQRNAAIESRIGHHNVGIFQLDQFSQRLSLRGHGIEKSSFKAEPNAFWSGWHRHYFWIDLFHLAEVQASRRRKWGKADPGGAHTVCQMCSRQTDSFVPSRQGDMSKAEHRRLGVNSAIAFGKHSKLSSLPVCAVAP